MKSKMPSNTLTFFNAENRGYCSSTLSWESILFKKSCLQRIRKMTHHVAFKGLLINHEDIITAP